LRRRVAADKILSTFIGRWALQSPAGEEPSSKHFTDEDLKGKEKPSLDTSTVMTAMEQRELIGGEMVSLANQTFSHGPDGLFYSKDAPSSGINLVVKQQHDIEQDTAKKSKNEKIAESRRSSIAEIRLKRDSPILSPAVDEDIGIQPPWKRVGRGKAERLKIERELMLAAAEAQALDQDPVLVSRDILTGRERSHTVPDIALSPSPREMDAKEGSSKGDGEAEERCIPTEEIPGSDGALNSEDDEEVTSESGEEACKVTFEDFDSTGYEALSYTTLIVGII